MLCHSLMESNLSVESLLAFHLADTKLLHEWHVHIVYIYPYMYSCIRQTSMDI